jgi:hypothetical protein
LKQKAYRGERGFYSFSKDPEFFDGLPISTISADRGYPVSRVVLKEGGNIEKIFHDIDLTCYVFQIFDFLQANNILKKEDFKKNLYSYIQHYLGGWDFLNKRKIFSVANQLSENIGIYYSFGRPNKVSVGGVQRIPKLEGWEFSKFAKKEKKIDLSPIE